MSNSKVIVLSSKIENNLMDTAYFKSAQVIPLETNEDAFLRKLSRICYDDSLLFILDQSLYKVVIFDIKGKFITSIHHIGNGPKEYLGIVDFCLDTKRKQVLILCDRPYKIMRFDYSGELISEKNIGDLFFNIISDSEMVYVNRSEISSNRKDEFELVCMDSNFNIVNGNIPLRENIKNTLFYRGRSLTSTLNNYYTRRFDNTIYQINGNEIEAKYSVDFKNNAISEDLIEEHSNVQISEICKENQSVYSMTDVVENQNYLMFNTNIGIFVYDKKNDYLSGYKTMFNTITKLGSNSFFSVGNNSQMIISAIPAEILKDIVLSPQNIVHVDKLIINLAQQKKEDDNPILFLHEFK